MELYSTPSAEIVYFSNDVISASGLDVGDVGDGVIIEDD